MGFASVVFDYDGALNAARRLWALAEEIETMMAARETARDAATVGFVGVFATQFGDRIGQERTDVNNAITQLRTGASEWAASWKDAMDEENRVRYARAYQYSKDNQGLIGHLDGVERPPDVIAVAVPTSPLFTATSGFQYFGNMV